MPPTLANGKICYLEIPAIEISRSVDFYQNRLWLEGQAPRQRVDSFR